ncbi:unnamed protein product [Darwinula stevensoni]|uniref:DOMON domain-containing protein n=1 Tax=Darwinula stevensoni TaxID=69355 RepID=A0A7R9A2Q4_9CRUS|nr:unnamed protein product [Darwinula stevensoni]CAG0889146.1 unnamed protein product [Darwinula stevensoni]
MEAMRTGVRQVLLFLVPLVLVQTQTWERHETLDRDGIVNLFWTANLENGEITFELHTKTQGWAGLGFSANGAMTGSDIVVGWIKDGQTFFTEKRSLLLLPNWDSKFAAIDTCDEDDFYITIVTEGAATTSSSKAFHAFTTLQVNVTALAAYIVRYPPGVLNPESCGVLARSVLQSADRMPTLVVAVAVNEAVRAGRTQRKLKIADAAKL